MNALDVVKAVPVPTHFNHRRFSKENGHEWEYSNVVIDTSPATYHRSCVTCGMVQFSTDDDGEWRDDLSDTLFAYRNRVIAALEQPQAADAVGQTPNNPT